MTVQQGFWHRRWGSFVLLGLVLVLCVVALELAFSRLSVSDSMGWNRTLPLAERAKRFAPTVPEKIVALGDSFAEWRAGEGVNMFDRLEKDLGSQRCKILNLGQAGADVIDYTATYHHYVTFRPDAIIISLYLGNDVLDYAETSRLKTIAGSMEEQRADIKQFIKTHSTLINFLFRLGKQHFAFMQAGSFEKNLKAMQQWLGLSDAQVRDRMGKLDPKIIELARSDSINPWILAVGITQPAYYKDLCLENSPSGRVAAESTIRLIREFYQAQKVHNFLVVLMPVSLQVSEQYDDYFRKCGYDLDDFPLQERRGLTRYLEKRLGELGIMTVDPTPALSRAYPAYIHLDEHLNAQGHKVVAETMTPFIREHFVWKSALD